MSFSGAFRRSESSGLTVEDLKFCREGVVCTLRRSKTDQEGAGREVGIPYAKNKNICPVLALKAGLKQAKIKPARSSVVSIVTASSRARADWILHRLHTS